MQQNGRKEKQSSKQPKKVSHHLVKSSVPLVNNLAKHSRSMLNNRSLNFLYIPSEDKVELPMDSTSDENINTRMCPNPIKYTDKPNTPASDHNNLPKSSQKSTNHSPTIDANLEDKNKVENIFEAGSNADEKPSSSKSCQVRYLGSISSSRIAVTHFEPSELKVFECLCKEYL